MDQHLEILIFLMLCLQLIGQHMNGPAKLLCITKQLESWEAPHLTLKLIILHLILKK